MAKITKDMTIAQVLLMDADSARIFFEAGMHCVGCPSASGESIEDACGVHGMEVEDLMTKLNSFFENK